MSILVTGSIAYDSIETPFGRVDDELGGSAVYFSIAASHFTSVSPVSVVGEDFKAEHLEILRSRGIDTSYIIRAKGKTFRWKGRYEYDMNVAHTINTELNVFESFRPDLSYPVEQISVLFLANIDPDLQLHVMDRLQGAKFVACDTMDFWISSKKDRLLKVIESVDVVFMNEGEVRFLTGEVNLVRAYQYLQNLGVEHLVIKRGEYGAIYFSSEGVFFVPAFPLDTVKDPTGAGDSFAGGMLGWLARVIEGGRELNSSTLRQAVVMGSVMASFAVEEFGVRNLLKISHDEILNRFKSFRKMTDFEPLSESLLRGQRV